MENGTVIMPHVGSSNNQTLDLEWLYLLQAFDEGFSFEPEAMKEDEWKHNVTDTSDNPKHHGVDWLFK